MPVPIYSIHNLNITNKNEHRLIIKQFDIHRGACYIIEGRMGAGKTTFIESLYKPKKIDGAEIKFENKVIHKYSNYEYQNQIAIVPQSFNPPWGIVNNYMIKIIGAFSHINNPVKRIEKISRKMNISDLLTRRMKSLTPGELRWVILATMISADSKVLFIDEIELHLGKKDLSMLINILHRKINYDGVTLIATTQNKELFSRLASVTMTLENGRITSVRSSSKKKR